MRCAAASRSQVSSSCGRAAFSNIFRKTEWPLTTWFARRSGQKSLSRYVVELQPYSVGIFEQQRVISRRPLILARRANDGGTERAQEAVQLINVGALAGAKAQMVQADPILLEPRPCVFGRRRADRDRGASTDAIIDLIGIDDRVHAEERQQLAVELTGSPEVRCGQENMLDAVDFHRLPPSSARQFPIISLSTDREHTGI